MANAPRQAGKSALRIATYNVNGIQGRLSVLLRWLSEEKPDIACLQELRAPDERFPKNELKKLGYDAVWHGQKSWNGVAILSRIGPPQETRRGLPGDPDDIHSRYIESRIGPLTIGCLYLPNGNPAPGPKFDYKLSWFKRLNRHARTLLARRTPVVLCGDFNCVPTPKDAYKPERWVNDAVFFPQTRALYAELLAQGWIDAIRHLHPDAAIYTYWDYFRNAFARNAGIRMDHLLFSPSLRKNLRAAGVDLKVRGWEKTSDHAPAWIDLSPPAAKRTKLTANSSPRATSRRRRTAGLRVSKKQ